MVCVPETAFVPLQLPDEVQAVALVDVQLRLAEDPTETVVVSAVRVTVGIGVTTATVVLFEVVPSAPVHDKP